MKNFKNMWNIAIVAITLFLMLNVGSVAPEDGYSSSFTGPGPKNEPEVIEIKPLARDSSGRELIYMKPKYDMSRFYFVETFDNLEESQKKWIKSRAKKDGIAEEIAKYDGEWKWDVPLRMIWRNDFGLVLKSKAKHAAIAARLRKSFTFKDNKTLVLQYEATMQNGQVCGGAYLKLLSKEKSSDDLTKFNDKTPYTIMFGPDKCGNDIKMHFIFRHVNPINGTITEKHCKKPKDRLEEPFKDLLPHLYRLVIMPDNTFEIRVDHKVIKSGSLLADFTPEVNPPHEIDDPNDHKPEDWDDREKIPDPSAQKPDDWDDDAPMQIPDPDAVIPEGWLENEPPMIPDESAKKPDDWDDNIDGVWEPPSIDNPKCENAAGCGEWKAPLVLNKKYKGKWSAPLIENPRYKGKWIPKKIPNPDYFEDLNPLQMASIFAVGIELWSMSDDILFDNIIITDNTAVADEFAAQTFDLKRLYIDLQADSLFTRMYKQVTAFLRENPWSYVIVGAFVIIIFVLLGLICVGKKIPREEDPKKTDAPQPDDAANVDAEIDGGSVVETLGSGTPSSRRGSVVEEDTTEQPCSSSRKSAVREINTQEEERGAGDAEARKRRVTKNDEP